MTTTKAIKKLYYTNNNIIFATNRITFTIFISTLILTSWNQLWLEPIWALTCSCNECPTDKCDTLEHPQSKCFKSVERYIENGTYERLYRFGCISGSDDSISAFQCQIDSTKHKEPIFVACCRDRDFCNDDLPEPEEGPDPRWALAKPPVEQLGQPTAPNAKTPIWPIVLCTLVISAFALCFFTILYEVTTRLFMRYLDKKSDSYSQDSICSFKVNIESQLKSQYLNHHHNNSSSASTHTYPISDYMSQKPDSPQENTCASIENSGTIPDLTSGVGTKVLEPRTMARVVDSGKTVPVGSGRFGRVFKGTYHCEDVAVKAFRSIDCESWSREEKILKKLNHENIVRFIASETYTVGDYVTETWMFLEFCPYGSLCDFLDQYEICGPQQAIKILYSVIKGLNYLHEDYSQGYKPPIAHRDIKSRNILMRTPDTCCLADFGHAVVKVNENTLDFGGYEHIQVGTIRYMAPEILRPNSSLDATQFHTFAQADLYQFGLVLWEVCHRTALDILHPSGSHRLPYDGVVPQNPDLDDMIKIVCEDSYRPPSSSHWDKHPVMKRLASLMVECWRPNPKARMETLGVKKKLKDVYDQLMPTQAIFYHNNLMDAFSISPNFKIDKDKTRSTDYTL